MKVAVIQVHAGTDPRLNREKALSLTRRALQKGAEFIVLPEVFYSQGSVAGQILEGETIPGENSRPFMELAQQASAGIVLGSLYEGGAPGGRCYNTSVFIDSKGKIGAKYRKRHLFKAKIRGKIVDEARQFRAGRALKTFIFKGFKWGMSICYDLRFPEFYQGYARKGCDVLLAPSAFTAFTGQAHWEVLLRARAIESQAYVLAPNHAGKNAQGVQLYGHSMIVDPWGRILARAKGNKEAVLIADIHKENIMSTRRNLPGIHINK